jgi:tetratricopeptide (TPR) repeat protein
MANRVSLTIIVKNGAPTLGDCLSSVRDMVDEIIVVDTGSSDNTKDIAHQHNAKVFDFPWCDSFAAARNESIRRASGDWIFWLDSDEYLDSSNGCQLRSLFADLGNNNYAYIMNCLCLPNDQDSCSGTVIDHIRLFRNHPAIRWHNRVHEQILPSLRWLRHTILRTGITISHSGYRHPGLRYKKLERNLHLLQLDLTEKPNDPFTLFNLGWTLTDLGRFAEAIPLLQRGLQHSYTPIHVIAKLYVLSTICHFRLGQLAEAWAKCQAGRAHSSADAELMFLEGQLCYYRGDFSGARASWERALEKPGSQVESVSDPIAETSFVSYDSRLREPLVQHHLALLDCHDGHFAAAENHWRTVLDTTPSFHPARVGLAELLLLQSRWSELEYLLSELDLHSSLDAAFLRARMHLARSEFAIARQLLEDVLRQAPQLLSARVILSHVLLQSGDERAAEPQLRRIVELAPGQADSWKNLSVLYRRTQRLGEAIAAAKAGCLHCPHNTDLLLLQGALLHEGGDTINAETCLLRVLEMAADEGPGRQLRAMARQHLIALYRGLGRHREAEAHCRALAVESPARSRSSETRSITNGQHAALAAPKQSLLR